MPSVKDVWTLAKNDPGQFATVLGSYVFEPTATKTAKRILEECNQLKYDMEQGRIIPGYSEHHADNYAHTLACIRCAQAGPEVALACYELCEAKEVVDLANKGNTAEAKADGQKDKENNKRGLELGAKYPNANPYDLLRNLNLETNEFVPGYNNGYSDLLKKRDAMAKTAQEEIRIQTAQQYAAFQQEQFSNRASQNPLATRESTSINRTFVPNVPINPHPNPLSAEDGERIAALKRSGMPMYDAIAQVSPGAVGLNAPDQPQYASLQESLRQHRQTAETQVAIAQANSRTATARTSAQTSRGTQASQPQRTTPTNYVEKLPEQKTVDWSKPVLWPSRSGARGN